MSSSAREGTVSADFVMKKKRKRHSPVDPCLGFYSESLSPEFRKSPPLEQHQRNSAKPVISDPPLGSTLARPSSCRDLLHDGFTSQATAETSDSEFSTPFAYASDPVPLPVELFLQRNARRTRIKKYGRRNNHIIQSSSPPVSNGSLENHQTDSLKDVLDNKEGDEGPSKSAVKFFDLLSRPSLILVPVKNQNTQAVRTKHRKRGIRLWSTVDPKRGIPFRGASFSKHDNKTHTSSNYRPLNKWKTLLDSVQRSQAGSVNKGSTTMSSMLATKPTIIRRQPLLFVPLADAEKAYATRFQPDNKAKSGTTFSAHDLRTTAPASLLLASTLASKKITRSSRELPSSDTPSSQNDLFRPMSSSELPPKTPVPSGSTPLAPYHAEVRASLPAEHHLNDSQPCSITVVHHESDTMADIESSGLRTRPSTPMCVLTPQKPMKPLASFLDGFLERVRISIQQQAANTSLSDCKEAHEFPAAGSLSGLQPSIQGTRITRYGSPPNSPVTSFKSLRNSTVQKSSPCLPLHSRRSRTRPTKRVRNRGFPFCGNVEQADSTVETDCGVAFGDATRDYGLESDTLPSSDEPEFPPYRPPSAPFDIHAALQLHSQTEGQGIQLSIPSRNGS